MSKTEYVYRKVLDHINNLGAVPVRLESERRMAEKHGVSHAVARRVLRRLVEEGHVNVKPGKGYFTCPSAGVATKNRDEVIVVYDATGAHGLIDQMAQEHELCLLRRTLEYADIGLKFVPLSNHCAPATLKRKIGEISADAYILVSLPPTLQACFAALGKPAISWGSTYEYLGFPSVSLNRLEITRELTEELFAAGHRQLCLLYEQSEDIACDDAQLGFQYAHNRWRIRFTQDRIIRVNRAKEGLAPAAKRLQLLAPTAILVSHATLLERLWSAAHKEGEKCLTQIEAFVLNSDPSKVLTHPAKLIQTDEEATMRMIARLLKGVLDGRPCPQLHNDVPWKLVDRR